jgi:hypothetical protein
MLDKRQVKALSDAYDKVYDLNSLSSYAFKDLENELERFAKEKGYKFILNQRTQKWCAKRDEQ